MKKIDFSIPDDERGVSPVIGVILMVAITVILAAVIASFVLGFGGSVSSNASAGVDVTEDQSNNGSNAYNVTVVSVGDNTDGVYCTENADDVSGQGYDPDNPVGVGETVPGCEGSVVAIGEGNTGNATIETLD